MKNSVPWVEVKRLEFAHQRAVLQIEQSQIEQADRQAHDQLQSRRRARGRGRNRASPDQIASGWRRHRRASHSPQRGMGQAGRHRAAAGPHGSFAGRGLLEFRQVLAARRPRPKKVTMTVDVGPSCRTGRVQGQIVFVSPLDEAGSEYRVWAEVENRHDPRRQEEWLLRPGATATMTIGIRRASEGQGSGVGGRGSGQRRAGAVRRTFTDPPRTDAPPAPCSLLPAPVLARS